MPLPQPTTDPAKPYRDPTGAALADYPRPSVAVDTAVLTLAPRTNPARGAPPHRLSVLLVRRPEGLSSPQWALPGTFLHAGELLADAVTRSLAHKAGITADHPAQLAVFDDPDRDERGWVLSVAHLAVLPYAERTFTTALQPDEQVDQLLDRCRKFSELGVEHVVVITGGKPWSHDRVDALGAAAAQLVEV